MSIHSSPIDLSISIVNYNTGDLLLECLRSIYEATHGISFEVIVVDNASHDGSPGLVRARFPQVTLVANQANLGYAHGNNLAYERSKGRYFLLLNPDTVVRPDALSAMVAYLDGHPEVAGVTCKLLNPNGTFQRYYKCLPSWGAVLGTFTLLKNVWPDNPWCRAFYMIDEPFETDIEVEQPPASCLMVRRELFPGTVILDERFPIFFNDIDLCRSLRDRGGRLYFLAGAEVVHHSGAGGVIRMGDEAIIDYLICLMRYYRKHNGALSAVLLWTVISVNSAVVLLGVLAKTLLGRKTPEAFRHECARRARLFRGRETFCYPIGFEPRTT